jgi:ankyrin repeat protein
MDDKPRSDVEMISVLLDRRAHIDARDELGWTPLIHAVWSCQTAAVKTLLERGASVNSRDAEVHAASRAKWIVCRRNAP